MTRSVIEGAARDNVLAELKRIRKRTGGATVEAMALAPTTCQLLGGGDPYVAFSRLQQHVLDEGHERSIRAAAASLGFLSDHATHLDRLTEAGQMLAIEQRHARRLSDEGLTQLATLIATNWTLESVPALSLTLFAEPGAVRVIVHATHPATIAMREPVVTIISEADGRIDLAMTWSKAEQGLFTRLDSMIPTPIPIDDLETSLAVQWRGEIWPKFEVRFRNGATADAVESLGNRLMVRLGQGYK